MNRDNLPYYAATSAEKAKVRRLAKRGTVKFVTERDSRIMNVNGKPRLVGREVYYVYKGNDL